MSANWAAHVAIAPYLKEAAWERTKAESSNRLSQEFHLIPLWSSHNYHNQPLKDFLGERFALCANLFLWSFLVFSLCGCQTVNSITSSYYTFASNKKLEVWTCLKRPYTARVEWGGARLHTSCIESCRNMELLIYLGKHDASVHICMPC